MLQPVRTKWRKAHKGRIHGTASRANFINYGAYALKALSPDRVTGKQIEAARVALTRHMKSEFGQEFSQIFQFQKNLLKYVWVKEKVLQNFMHVV